jgi:hypothetical protein
MTFVQKLFKTILPAAWAADLEAESKAWKVTCPCGHTRSIWELGGIRWKASGAPRRLLDCPQCGKREWHTVSKAV